MKIKNLLALNKIEGPKVLVGEKIKGEFLFNNEGSKILKFEVREGRVEGRESC